MKQLGYLQDTTLSAAQALPTIPSGARFVLMQAEGDDLRWRDDGTNPTASVGMLLEEGQSFLYDLGPLSNIKVIETTGGGILNVTYYK